MTLSQSKGSGRHGLTGLVALLALPMVALLFHLRPSLDASRGDIEADIVGPTLSYSPAQLRAVSLGFEESMADLLWLDGLSYFGAYQGRLTEHGWVSPYLAAITALDPRFSLVYEWAGTVIMYGSGVNNASVLASSEVLEAGVQDFPDEWRLRMMLGVNYLFEYQPVNAEERAHYQALGHTHLRLASLNPAAPATIANLAWSNRDSRSFHDTYRGLQWQMLLSNQQNDQSLFVSSVISGVSTLGPQLSSQVARGAERKRAVSSRYLAFMPDAEQFELSAFTH